MDDMETTPLEEVISDLREDIETMETVIMSKNTKIDELEGELLVLRDRYNNIVRGMKDLLQIY